MDFLRELISGNKSRYKEDNFNLDFTYITDRIIAMAFPASGLESFYRNSIDDVKKLIESRHSFNYLIINLSDRKYDYSKFQHRVLDFKWLDHHAPALETLFNIVWTMNQFLKQDTKNVVIVHCNAGKGRTGTALCCFLYSTGRFNSMDEVHDFFSLQRFESQK